MSGRRRRPVRRLKRAATSVVVAMAASALVACTDEAPGNTSSTTPPPASTTSSPTPTMSQQEEDFRDAVLAYYDGYDEMIRLLKAGGNAKPTSVMRETMTGDYLEYGKQLVGLDVTAKGTAVIDGYAVGAQTEKSIPIRGCENQSKLRFFDNETGKEKTADVTGLLVRDVIATKGADQKWRIAKIEYNSFVEPKDWEQQTCMIETERPS